MPIAKPDQGHEPPSSSRASIYHNSENVSLGTLLKIIIVDPDDFLVSKLLKSSFIAIFVTLDIQSIVLVNQ